MTKSSNAGRHAVQFYKSESYIHRRIADFFTRGADPGNQLILLSRPHTITAVAEQLASGRYSSTTDAADHILFIDAEAVLSQIMDGETLDQDCAERLFRDTLSQARPSRMPGVIRLYGETADILYQHGQQAAALQLEGFASVLLDLKPQLAILCGYAFDRFKYDTSGAQLRAVCQKNSNVIPAESFDTALPAYPQAVMFQQLRKPGDIGKADSEEAARALKIPRQKCEFKFYHLFTENLVCSDWRNESGLTDTARIEVQ